MKIKSIQICGFRGYKDRVSVDIDDLTVIVGRNDVGKSTILEALDIFFNDGRGCVKLDKDDINKESSADGETTIEIAVEFEDLPAEIVIDATNSTTLAAEHLLTTDGTLFVVKRYPNAGKPSVLIRCHHPSSGGLNDLLRLKHADLRSRLDSLGVDCEDKTKSAAIRQSLWASETPLARSDQEIDASKAEAKEIWEKLSSHLPLFTLFQSDRKNSDGDSEIQDPMKLAVREILADPALRADLDQIAGRVKDQLGEVAGRTLAKLEEMSPGIAASLQPRLPDTESLKWPDVFKSVSITGDEDIPINKRGSGVKRLVLLNFFRAEAERRQAAEELPSIVYAIEEPETSQHPQHQRVLIDAIRDLAAAAGVQVLLTTHSPEIVKRLEFDCIRLIKGQAPGEIACVLRHELPYPSLNEVNYSAFGESSPEYHNELYGYIESRNEMARYELGQSTRPYIKLRHDGTASTEQITLTRYIRHQIHHPENAHNIPFTPEELSASIAEMRKFIEHQIR